MRDEAHLHPDTILQHLGEDDRYFGAVTPPICMTSLFVHEDCASFEESFSYCRTEPEKYNYSRIQNPTLRIVERKLAALESTDCAKLFSSGMAAISAAIMSCVEQGAHVVCVDTAYGPTRQFLSDYLPKFGVTATMVPGLSTGEVIGAVRPETKLIVLESPSSFLFRCQDFPAIVAFAKERGIATMTDNSYASPLFQNPARFGVDLVVHSATKFLGGHSDLVAGVVCASEERMSRLLANEVALFGGALSPFPAWLIMRGMRTLRVRMEDSKRRGDALAAWLAQRPEVARVFHVGDPRHPQRDLIERQMTGWCSLLSFEPMFQTKEQVVRFLDALEVFQLGVSWGGHESLATGFPMPIAPGEEPRWVVRLYAGMEDMRDLQADLDRAFVAAG